MSKKSVEGLILIHEDSLVSFLPKNPKEGMRMKTQEALAHYCEAHQCHQYYHEVSF